MKKIIVVWNLNKRLLLKAQKLGPQLQVVGYIAIKRGVSSQNYSPSTQLNSIISWRVFLLVVFWFLVVFIGLICLLEFSLLTG
jgi:hypothetical protein